MAHSSVRFSQRLGRIVILAGFIAGNVITPALAGPSGGRIIAGQGAISQSGPNSTINQSTDRLIIEWQNFDTTAGESVRFNQPSSSASVLNRIISGNATVFDGSLFANGNVVIVNGSGIHFGPNSRIDVGSLIASTADISNSNFLNNRLIFDRPGQPDASITNAGTITVRDTGLAALVAPGVENSGLIQANLGTVILAAGEAHTIDFNGDGLMSFTVTKPTRAKPKDRNGKTLDALVSNKGEIRADGGTVLLTARQASRVLDNSINMSGVVRANSVGVRNGKIVLFGGKRGRVNVSGKIRARGKRRGQRGGRVHITGRKVAVPIAKIDVTGKAGGGEVLIGGAYRGGKLSDDSSIGYLQAGDLVSILTGDGAGAAGNGYFPNAESVFVGADTVIDASATGTGEGGSVILWGTESIGFHGTVNTLGGANGFVEVSTKGTGTIDGVGNTGHMLVDPGDVCVSSGGSTNNCTAGATLLASSTILAVLNTGSVFELNTDALGTSGTGRVDFGGGLPMTVTNNSGTIGTFRILAADDINTRQVVLLNNGSTGTNYEFFAGSSATGAPQSTADVILFGQDLATGGGNVIFDAADDILIRDPIRSGGGDVTLIARGGDAGATVSFITSDAAIVTTDGMGNAGTVSITTDNIDVAASAVASPLIDANGTGGVIGFAPLTAGRAIDLGTDNAASLSFTDADLNRFAAPILRIGSATSGDITVSAPVSPASAAALELVSGGAINVNNSITTGNGDVSLTANTIEIGAAVNVGTGSVTLAPLTANLPISLGTQVSGFLSLTDTELDFLTASTVLVGNTASGDITVSAPVSPANTGTLELVTAGAVIDNTPTEQSDLIATNVTISAGTGIGTAANDIDVASALLTLTNTTSGDVNVFNTGAVTVTGDSVVSGFAAVGTVFNVDNAATVTSSGTLAVDALTGNLDGNLTATGGINGNLSTINVLGSAGGAEIQDAVDLAATGATVNVAAGSYAAFTADVTNLSVIGVGETTIVNAASPAITITANGTSISNMLLQGTGTADDVGILLDGTTTPGLTGITITNVDFDNLDDGIRSQGNIGDGVAANVDVTIAGTSTADPAMFTDFLDAAIDVGDTNGDAVYSITDVIVADGADADAFSTGGPGFRFGAIGAVRVQRATISSAFGDGIEFAAQTGATIDVLDSSITARDDGIDFLGLSGGTTTIARNTLLRGTRNTFGDGLEFTSITNGATVNIVGNTEISGRGDAIEFENGADASTITIAGNTTIQGDTSDAIVILAPFINSTVTIGSASATVDGVVTAFGGNSIAGLGDDGISLQGVTGGSLTIRDNALIRGGTDNGLDFINRAFANAAISITGNTIQAVDHGIYKNNGVTGTTTFEILNNTIGTSTNRIGERGIFFDFGGILDTATVTIGGTNQVFSTQQALYITDVQSPNALSITGGTYDGLSGALLVDNSGFGPTVTPAGQVVIGTAAFVGGSGSNVADIRTRFSRPLGVDFSGSSTFDGGANGLFLSGTAIDVLNDTFGTIAIGSTTAPTTNFIQLANGAEFLPGSPTLLDARTVSFAGTLGNDLTTAQALALEDQLIHFPDDNTLGVINTNDLLVVNGESIQLAVNAAGALGGAQTVTVTSGTFGGSVEVWVDDLTLVGQGATTIIDTDSVDAFANNGDVNNGFDIVASSALSGGGTVTGVTIDGFAFDTVTTSGANTGIRLGGAAVTRIVENTTIQNNTFNDLNEGIFRNNTIGTTTITGNTMTNIADRGIVFANRAINGETFIITNNAVTSVDRSLVFFPQLQNSNATIQGNTFVSGSDALIFFFGANNSSILVGGDTAAEANDIFGTNRGIFSFSLNGGDFTVANNTRIASGATLFGSGIELTGVIQNGANVEVVGNSLIEGNFSGLLVVAPILSSTMTVAGNTQINGITGDGVSFVRDITDSNVTIGPATVTVDGTLQNFGGNTINGDLAGIAHFAGTVIDGTSVITYANNDITGGDDGIFFDAIAGNAQINITDNTSITGQNFEGIFFFEDISENATVTIARNAIQGGDDGVEFDERVLDDVTLTLTDNTITGVSDGIEFEEEILGNAVVEIGGNTINATNQQGIEVNGLFDQASLNVDGNTITGGENGIAFEAQITGSATTRIASNTVNGGNGIAFNDFVDTTVGVQINGNTDITGTSGDGIVFNGPVTDTAVTIDTNTIAGSEDGIDLAGMFAGTASATITGNMVNGTGSEGIDTGNIGDSVEIAIGNNTISGATGLRLGAVTTAATNGVRIVNNARISGTTQHGVHLDGPVTNTPITINGNNEIAGADTGIKATGTITDAIVNLDGNTAVSGGVNGVHFESLSGATINTANTDITGGTNGFKAFGSTAAGATSRLNFTNAALRGTFGAGLSVTTTAGGSGIDTNLGGGLTLTGLPSLALSGPNQTLVGDTLGDTRFVSVNGGNYIELSNGALFEPGRPTIIDGTTAFFDGVQVPAGSPPALLQSIENRIIDFDDNNTLGQIFFGPIVASDFVDIARLINQFALVTESSVRISNPQTPGDLILRPDYPFDILFGDLLANLYPLGGCLPVFDDTGAVASFSCIAPAHGSDISEFVDTYMADLP